MEATHSSLAFLLGLGVGVLILGAILSLAVTTLFVWWAIRLLHGERSGFLSAFLTVLIFEIVQLALVFTVALASEVYGWTEQVTGLASLGLLPVLVFAFSLIVAARHRMSIFRGFAVLILSLVLALVVVLVIVAIVAGIALAVRYLIDPDISEVVSLLIRPAVG